MYAARGASKLLPEFPRKKRGGGALAPGERGRRRRGDERDAQERGDKGATHVRDGVCGCVGRDVPLGALSLFLLNSSIPRRGYRHKTAIREGCRLERLNPSGLTPREPMRLSPRPPRRHPPPLETVSNQ